MPSELGPDLHNGARDRPKDGPGRRDGAFICRHAEQQSGALPAGIATTWRWQGVTRSLDLETFVACLPASGRQWLETRLMVRISVSIWPASPTQVPCA